MPLSAGVRRFLRACLAFAVALACLGTVARADELDAVRQLQAAGRPEQALQAVRALIARRPNDPQFILTEALLLQRLHRDQQAIDVLDDLIRRYPELPEPYNNLAVLYAARGDYAMALAQLRKALRANPDYATARANLGDVYVQLAEQAYREAAANSGDAAAQAHARAALSALLSRAAPGVPARASSKPAH